SPRRCAIASRSGESLSYLNTTGAVDERARIGRQLIGTPRHVPVGPDQDQATLIELADRRVRDRHDFQRHLSLVEGLLNRARIGGVATEPQKGKAAAECVDGGTPGGEPSVWRPAARIGCRVVLADRKR